MTFKSVALTTSGNGSWELRNSEDGADWVGRGKMISRFCFAMEIRGSVKHLLGNNDYSPERQVSRC